MSAEMLAIGIVYNNQDARSGELNKDDKDSFTAIESSHNITDDGWERKKKNKNKTFMMFTIRLRFEHPRSLITTVTLYDPQKLLL